MSGMTGGTARMVSRNAMPASQSSSSARSGEIMSQAARRRGTMTTRKIEMRANAAVVKKIDRGAP